MNSKKIKELRWHKKVLIDTINENGIHADDIGVALDNIIDNLDEIRRDKSPVNGARAEGFSDGFIMGHMQGKTEGWNAAMEDVSDKDSIDENDTHADEVVSEIDVKGVSCGTLSYYDGYVNGTYVGSSETVIGCVEVCKRVIEDE